MASNRGGGRGGGGGGRGSGGGGRGYGQENPNVAQGAYGGGGRGGGRGGQYPGGRGGGGGYESQYQHGGGRGDSQYQRGGYGGGGGGRGYQGGSDGGGRGRGSYQGGSDGGGGRGRGSYQGGSDGGGGRGRGSYQGSSDGGRGRGRGSYQGGNDGGRGRGRGGYHGPGRGQQHIARPSREAASLDLPQAGPRLAERYAAEAARLRGQFKNLQIQTAEPKFPPRPGFGTKGQKCDVKANHFFVGFADRGLHQYDVSITPEVTLRSVYRAVMSKLVSEYQQSHLGGRLPAYDGRKCLYTAGPLPFTSRDFEIALSDDRDPHGPRRERNFRVTIKFATLVNLQQLQMLMAGYSTDIPAQALQVLDIVLRDVILNERNEMEYVAVGRSFFSPNIRSVRLGQGIMSWKGFYQSIRPTQMGLSLNIDMSSTAFIEPLPLVDFVQAILNRGIYERHISDVEYAKIKRALKGLRIEVTHRGNIRRKYRISSLTHQATSDLKFESSSGVTRTVKDYFRETYNLQIRYDFLPCLQVGSEQKLNYLPMEVCKIVPGQRYQKKLNEGQVSEMLKFTCQVPRDRERSIRAAVVNNEYNSANRATEFGIEVDNLPASVEARVLPAPTLKYHDSGAERECLPSYGAWNMRNKKVVNGARITNWACINFSQQVSDQDAQQFCFELAKMSRVTGLDLADLRLPIYLSRPDQIEGALRRHYQDMINRLRGRRLELLVAILPDNNGTLYGNLKRICETDIGIVSQCCLTKNVFKKSPQYFANVALKINAKVGGRNSVFADIRRSLPIVSNKPTIIFGADVTHPSPMEDLTPSIASVVASQDWPEVTKYNGLVRAQGHREELIRDLEEIVKELLLSFQRESRQRPQQLIFYRDGVSEGQFEQVLQKEIPEIEKAWKSLYNEKPPITFIVVQKRHHTRLFPNSYSDRSSMDRSGNVLPGTVVDCKICHPTEFDFYLCSHAGIQGTSRPTHYHVLRDDNKFSADDLQSLTNNLCYIYASCTRSVSIAPPAYYAHKLAFRARFYLDQDSDAGSMITGSTSAVRPLPSLKDNVKSVMFYC